MSYWDAFDRLKAGRPELLRKGTAVSQNNIAREAGSDPSALKKSRFPSLIAAIQQYVKEHSSSNTPPSSRQQLLGQRKRNRSLREKLEAMQAQRDHAFSLLAEAESTILNLAAQLSCNVLEQSASPEDMTQIEKPQKH